MSEEITKKVEELKEAVADKKPRWITKVAHATKESLHDTKESLKRNKGKVAMVGLGLVPIVGGGLVAWKLSKDDMEGDLDYGEPAMVGPDADVPAAAESTEA